MDLPVPLIYRLRIIWTGKSFILLVRYDIRPVVSHVAYKSWRFNPHLVLRLVTWSKCKDNFTLKVSIQYSCHRLPSRAPRILVAPLAVQWITWYISTCSYVAHDKTPTSKYFIFLGRIGGSVYQLNVRSVVTLMRLRRGVDNLQYVIQGYTEIVCSEWNCKL